ncbi:cytochrome c oxidase assembly protein [Thiohalophilus sp.]|uniref:cytochrome c oxidase assembly protein n=1 Tax=Thiohalophilus sp. TaxID=3028392 RepID=UPI0039750BC7
MTQDNNPEKTHGRLISKLTVVVFAMFGFGFALVPLYDMVCDAFGINGRFLEIQDGSYTAEKGSAKGRELAARKDLDRTVTVQFTTTLNQNMAWEFKTMTRTMKLHPGEIRQVKFYARNRTDQTVVAQAVPSLSPSQAVKYFTKMECFCFNQQTFEPGEVKEMPLVFVVDPDLPDHVNTITLGYTFFDTDKNARLEGNNKQITIAENSQVYSN